MAVYEEKAEVVADRIKESAISEVVKDSILKFVTTVGENVKIFEFKGEPAPANVDIVVVPSNIDLTVDPGGKVVIINAQAGSVNVVFDATTTERIVVGSAKDDVIRFTGSKSVTVETGGGNDSVVTALGDDVVIASGRGRVTIDTGGGFDRVVVQGARTDHLIKKEPGRVIIRSDEIVISDAEAIQFEDGRITVVASKKFEGYIARLYEVLFNREADLEGLKYWFEAAKNELTRIQTAGIKITDEQLIKEIIKGFMTSKEFTEMYAKVDDVTFIKMLYKGMADREPDPTGFNFWLNALKTGASKVDVVVGFVTSEEAIKVLGEDGNNYVIDLWL